MDHNNDGAGNCELGADGPLMISASTRVAESRQSNTEE